MPQTRVDSVLALSGFPPLVKNVPPSWPNRPQPDKISLLWQYNYHDLYHKFSPFTDYKNNLLSGVLSDKQPYVYTFIDEEGDQIISRAPKIVKSLLNTVNINQDSVNDVIRIGKWQVSSLGVQFLATQLLIQRLQPFDETRIYNPLSVLLSTVQPMTIGLLDHPTRHVEPNISGLIGAAGISNFIGRGYTTPSSTAGDVALSDFNTGQGKGLLRGGTATTAYNAFNSQWPVSGGSNTGIGTSILAGFKSAINQLFGGGGKQPTGTIYRADETAYTTMVISKRSDVSQPWFANPKTIQDPPPKPKGSSSTLSSAFGTLNSLISIASNPTSLIGMGMSALFPSTTGNHYVSYDRKRLIAGPNGFLLINVGSGVKGKSIKGKPTGYTVQNTDTYGNVVGTTDEGLLDKSDMLVQFSYYADPENKYDSKFTDGTQQKVQDVSNNLKQVISNIEAAGTYDVQTSTYSKLLSSGNPKAIGYDNLFQSIPNTGKTVDNTYAVRQEYREAFGKPSTIDKSVNFRNNLRFATSFASDGLNQVGILKRNKNGDIEIPYSAAINAEYNGWTKYQPYKDDLIAFFFYDVVNQKYIPFRATVKGISEGNTAFWDEIRYIGRADQMYSYNGFSRTLSFSFNVVINSITELLPSWKKINYLASVTKPSNYTRSETINGSYNRFIVPPMFMITIGDLYKYQPIVIRNLTVNIPEDAVWETLNEDNSPNGWSFLNGKITSKVLQGKAYGQLPREVEINVEGALLEKERSIVGGSHFGHAPRVDNWEDYIDSNGNMSDIAFNVGSEGTNYLPEITDLHKQMIEVNPPATPTPVTSRTPSIGNGLDHLNQ